MKTTLIAALVLLSVISANAGRESASRTGRNGGTVEAQGGSVGRFSAGSVQAEGANGATYDASGVRVGRFGAANSSAQGANGNTVDRSARSWNGAAVNGATSTTTYNNNNNGNTATINRGAASTPNAATGYRSTTINDENASYRSATVYHDNTTYTGYRSGYVYANGSYQQANVTVNTVYVAPIGAYAGWKIVTQPQYVTYPAYATYPVEVAVQVELTQQGYYNGKIDGNIGPKTQQAIAKYQAANNLPPSGQINQALLQSLDII